MLRIEFDEERLILEHEVSGDIFLNAKQLAGMMDKDESIAQLVAMALPYYCQLNYGVSPQYTRKIMEAVADDYELYLENAGQVDL